MMFNGNWKSTPVVMLCDAATKSTAPDAERVVH
jgi:hypothetical protein